jgi:hypothetical protein
MASTFYHTTTMHRRPNLEAASATQVTKEASKLDTSSLLSRVKVSTRGAQCLLVNGEKTYENSMVANVGRFRFGSRCI